MALFVSPTAWESKAALLAHLEAAGQESIILGRDAESPRCFYTLSAEYEQKPMAIVVWSSGLGSKPSLVLLGNRQGLVGHDTRLTWIDLSRRAETASRRLDGVFYEFLPLDREDQVLVLHELGAMRVDFNGSVLWSVDTDVVERWYLDGDGNLILTEMDGHKNIGVALESGRIFKP
jgi:hypothetical protein